MSSSQNAPNPGREEESIFAQLGRNVRINPFQTGTYTPPDYPPIMAVSPLRAFDPQGRSIPVRGFSPETRARYPRSPIPRTEPRPRRHYLRLPGPSSPSHAPNSSRPRENQSARQSDRAGPSAVPTVEVIDLCTPSPSLSDMDIDSPIYTPASPFYTPSSPPLADTCVDSPIC